MTASSLYRTYAFTTSIFSDLLVGDNILKNDFRRADISMSLLGADYGSELLGSIARVDEL